MSPIFAVGSRCLAPLDGALTAAHVIHTRCDPPSPSSSSSSSYSHYLHFLHTDRRLDRWIDESGMLPLPSPSSPLPSSFSSSFSSVNVSMSSSPSSSSLSSSLSSPSSLSSASLPPSALLSSSLSLSPLDSFVEGKENDREDDEEEEEERIHTRVKNIERVVFVCPIHPSSPSSPSSSPSSSSPTPTTTTSSFVVAGFDLSSAWELDSWYFSPFPSPCSRASHIFFCSLCLFYCGTEPQLVEHFAECSAHHPPGTEIYRASLSASIAAASISSSLSLFSSSPSSSSSAAFNPLLSSSPPFLSVFEVDGAEARLYCQRLSLFSKLFIEHKSAIFDVEPFLFYVLCEEEASGFTPVAYFSKEKLSSQNHNLACLLTFPQHQQKGYGRLLIDLSFQLSKREGKPGSPEKPLSDLGAKTYRRLWLEALYASLVPYASLTKSSAFLPLDDVSLSTGIAKNDLLSVAKSFDLVRYVKGQHVLSLHNNAKHFEQLKREVVRPREKERERERDEEKEGEEAKQTKGTRVAFFPELLLWTPPTFKRPLRDPEQKRMPRSS